MINAKVLYETYKQVKSTTDLNEDTSCGLLSGAIASGADLDTVDMQEHREFLARYTDELGDAFGSGSEEVFNETVAKCVAADEERRKGATKK